jgi:hypothetical protein
MIVAPILDIRRAPRHDFRKVVIEYCNRESNMVAHVLAQQSRVDPCLCGWTHLVLLFISFQQMM